VREAILLGNAPRVRASLPAWEREEVDALIAQIEEDPSVDNRLKFDLPRFPVILKVFDNGTWQIAYDLPDEATVAIYSIARATDPDAPRPR
jgi:hypothetical protein